jgi:hypothetical protein
MATFMLLKQQGNKYSSSSLYACDAWNLTVQDEYRSKILGKRGVIGNE